MHGDILQLGIKSNPPCGGLDLDSILMKQDSKVADAAQTDTKNDLTEQINGGEGFTEDDGNAEGKKSEGDDMEADIEATFDGVVANCDEKKDDDGDQKR